MPGVDDLAAFFSGAGYVPPHAFDSLLSIIGRPGRSSKASVNIKIPRTRKMLLPGRLRSYEAGVHVNECAICAGIFYLYAISLPGRDPAWPVKLKKFQLTQKKNEKVQIYLWSTIRTLTPALASAFAHIKPGNL
jgi:hypothetical protein